MAPAVKPLLPSEFSISEPWVLLCKPDPESWLLLLRDLLGGGAVNGDGRAAGPLSKEFPSYLVHI